MMLLLLASFGYSLRFGKKHETTRNLRPNLININYYNSFFLIIITISYICIFVPDVLCLPLTIAYEQGSSNLKHFYHNIIATIFFQYICMLSNRVVVRGRIFRRAQDCLGWFRSFHEPPFSALLICLGQFPGF